MVDGRGRRTAAAATVDEAGAVELARRVLAAEGVDDGELGTRVRRARTRSATLKREHLGIDEATDVLSFPIDGARRRARRRAAAARRRRPLPGGRRRRSGGRRSCTALLHLLGYDHGAEMEARERVHRAVNAPRRRAPSLIESFNYAFEGIIHVLRTQRNMRIHFAVARSRC